MFSWYLIRPDKMEKPGDKPHKLYKFSAGDKPRLLTEFDLPMHRAAPEKSRGNDQSLRAEVDSWASPTTIWLTPGVVKRQKTETLRQRLK